MTLLGKKNHYGVKLLKGYGVSISLKDNRLCLKGGLDPFTGEQETEGWFASQIPYERIVISGKGYLSTEAVKLLSDHNTNIILTDTHGNLVTAMHKVMSSPTATNYRIAQYDTFRNPEKVAYLQEHFLKMKLESQIQFLTSKNGMGSSAGAIRLRRVTILLLRRRGGLSVISLSLYLLPSCMQITVPKCKDS